MCLVLRQRNNIETTCQKNNNKRPKNDIIGNRAVETRATRVYDNNHCDGVLCELAAAYLFIYFYVFDFLFFQMKNTAY